MVKRGLLTVISGFSGAGKGTIVGRLLKDYDNYVLSVSMTTRKPRAGEVDGESYFFVTMSDFEKNIADGKMLEYAKYVDNYYGTPRAYVESMLSRGKDVILEIEIQGAMKVKELMPESLLLFVMPPSVEELRRRLVGRGTESADVIEKRMERAIQEAEAIADYEYIVVNDDLDRAVSETNDIIQGAKFRVDRNKMFVELIRDQLNGGPAKQ